MSAGGPGDKGSAQAAIPMLRRTKTTGRIWKPADWTTLLLPNEHGAGTTSELQTHYGVM
jgi:hypothetical protein